MEVTNAFYVQVLMYNWSKEEDAAVYQASFEVVIRSLRALADALERPRAHIKRCPDKIQASGRPLARSVEAAWLKEGTCSAPRDISAFQGRCNGSDGSVPNVTMLLLCEWKDGAEVAE